MVPTRSHSQKPFPESGTKLCLFLSYYLKRFILAILLVLWEFHKMQFEHSQPHSSPNHSLQSLPTQDWDSPPPPQLSPVCVSLLVLEIGTTMVCGLLRVTSLKKTDYGSGVKSLQCSCRLSGFHSQPTCSSSCLAVTLLSTEILAPGRCGKVDRGWEWDGMKMIPDLLVTMRV